MLTALFMFIAVLTVLVILYVASNLISEYNSVDREEMSSYECGFEHHSLSRIPLSMRYFFLTLIFLVFDIEIMFLLFLPLNVIGYFYTIYSITVSLLFVIILLLGLFYEWSDGRLDWVI